MNICMHIERHRIWCESAWQPVQVHIYLALYVRARCDDCVCMSAVLSANVTISGHWMHDFIFSRKSFSRSWNTYHLWDANICNFSICGRQRYDYTIDCWWSYVLGETKQNYCIKTNTNIQNRTNGLHRNKKRKSWRVCIKLLVSWWLKSHLLCLFRGDAVNAMWVYVCRATNSQSGTI